MSKETLAVLAGGVISGVLYASVVIGAPGTVILAYLAQLPLFAAGLGLGVTASLAAGVAGFVTAGLISGLLGAVIYALFNWAPALLVTRQALLSRGAPDGSVEWYPPGLLVTWLTGLGSALFAAAVILFSGSEGGLEASVREGLVQVAGELAPDGDMAGIVTVLETLAPIVPAIAVASWMVMVVVNGALAQGTLVRFGRNLRPSPDIAALELPPWMPVALAGAALLAWFGDGGPGFIGQNMVVILAVPFFFSGLGTIHALVRRFDGGPLVLVVFYVFLAMLQWPVVLITGLGLVEHWAGFRRHWRRTETGEEDK
jgi:hypothetical protein